jgi:hypothetical protein
MKTGAYSLVDAGSLTPKTPRAARPIFLFGFVGMALLLAGSVFLGIAALLRDLRPRQWHRSMPRRLR